MANKIQIVNKEGTPVRVSEDNELFVRAFTSKGEVASEVTLASVLDKLTASERTPTLSRETTAGTIAAGAYSASILNAGGANGTLLGAVIKPGETINIDAGDMNNTLSVITYDATGTELLISTLT